MKSNVDYNSLINGFKKIGIKPGLSIIVHSSLSSFGKVEGGPESVVAALKECAGPEGFIIMPVFTYGNGVYDKNSTPSETGLISEVFRKSEGVYRSHHPTHSASCWGKGAKEAADSHELFFPFSEKSPFYELIKQDGDVLLIGVDHTASSLMHLAQFLAKVPYLKRPKLVQITDFSGKVKEIEVCRAGCSLGFNKIEKFLDKAFICEVMIGKSKVRKFKAREVVGKSVDLLKSDPAALFCDKSDCFSCNEARRMI